MMRFSPVLLEVSASDFNLEKALTMLQSIQICSKLKACITFPINLLQVTHQCCERPTGDATSVL